VITAQIVECHTTGPSKRMQLVVNYGKCRKARFRTSGGMKTLGKSCEGMVRNREMPKITPCHQDSVNLFAITSISLREKTLGRSGDDWIHECRTSLVVVRRTVMHILVNDRPLAISRDGLSKGSVLPLEYSCEERCTTHRVSFEERAVVWFFTCVYHHH